jgi:hypothetical protein
LAVFTSPHAKDGGPAPVQRVMKSECSMSRSLRSDVQMRERTRRRGDAGTDMAPPAAVRYAELRTYGEGTHLGVPCRGVK